MSRRIVRWTRRATLRLDQIGDHILKDSPGAAGRVIARIVSAVDKLCEQPGMGRSGRIKGTRELVFADIPCIVAYRVTTSAVEVVTVMHGAQRWPDKL
ncbi:Plasmid stabilization system protein ParE [Mesorhizobium sp. NFR06]|uniref:type II toxin-antitoxin system RelE/ParE family toxin n=1 Tax=Mesorhizobium sp. NFR06 TaxID=1566290 RepID=UPI0008E797D7|nr:type II toxin-antitoxin system RelE/ParE family toxin [Mesorhizobium sp. NFR06]SFO66913.1 Plasmid stabilization system protein ParE [Mesorhizobium sp. NFR06]